MKIYSTILSLIALSAISSVHAEGNIEHGKKIFNRSCALCHGKQAEKSAMGQSQIINTFSQEKIVSSLQDRKSGKIIGEGNRIKEGLTEKDMQDVADYIQTLKQ